MLAKSEVTVYSRKDSTSKLAKSAVSSVFDLPTGALVLKALAGLMLRTAPDH